MTDPYERSAAYYDLFVGRVVALTRATQVQLAPPEPGSSVLDVGCGTGADLVPYYQAGCEIHGVDLSPAMIEVARRKFDDGVDLRCGDAAALPYPDGSMDLVMTSLTLHEMSVCHRDAVFDEMVRVLCEGGRLLLNDFMPGPYAFPAGWGVRAFILILEIMAGREHYRNGREFLRRGGLASLVGDAPLKVLDEVRLGAGTTGFLLLAKH